MVTPHPDDGSPCRGGWHPERVPLALNDERRDLHMLELGEPARWRGARCPARRLQREGEAQHRDGAGSVRGTAGNPGSERPTTDDQPQPAQLARLELLDNRSPGGIELTGGCG